MAQDERTGLHACLGLRVDADPVTAITRVVRDVEKVAADGAMKLHESFVRTIVRYRDVMAYMNDFFTALRPNPRKDTPYDDAALHALLAAAAVL